MSDYSHPLGEVPGDYPAGYPSSGTTSLAAPGPASQSVGLASGSILALRFTGDHGVICDATDSYGSDGKAYRPKPEWIVNAVNTPVTYSRKQRIKVNVTVKLQPSGLFFKLVGDGGQGYLRFEQDGLVSTGSKQSVQGLVAADSLPAAIGHMQQKIRWYAQGNGWKADLGESGPHDLFVLWSKPIGKSSRGHHNPATRKRLELMTGGKLGGGKSELSAIARAVQLYLNSTVVSTVIWEAPKPGYDRGQQYWAILDGNAKGHCFEGSMLMELMLGVLGVPAIQKHLHGGTTPAEIDKRLAYGTYLPGLQSRTCYQDGREELNLLYGESFQEGQGCCEVDHKLYAVWAQGNAVGSRSGKRSAAHHTLLQLERFWKPESGNKFLIWARTIKGKSGEELLAECLAPAKAGVQGPPTPPVPPAPT